MWIILTMTMMTSLLVLALMLLSSSISMKTFHDQEKSSPFECGFDPQSSARLPFSMHFFLIAVIFLIFDVEIALLLPLIILLQWSKITLWSILSSFFIMILLLGLYHEWNQGALEWAA
nr:NADH dehydrogenase subunit 3 [Hemigyrus spinosus spinosus]